MPYFDWFGSNRSQMKVSFRLLHSDDRKDIFPIDVGKLLNVNLMDRLRECGDYMGVRIDNAVWK